MKILDKTCDFTHTISVSDIRLLGLEDLFEKFKKQGFNRLVGYTNQYGFPAFKLALTPEEEVPKYVELFNPSFCIWELK